MDGSSSKKNLPKWFYPLTLAVNILADAVILFFMIVHPDFYTTTGSLFALIAAILLVGVTVFTGIMRSKFGSPAKLTVGTLIYHAVIMVATVFILNFYALSNMAFPYPMLAVIPGITTVLSLLFLFMDLHSDRKVRPRNPKAAPEEPQGTTFSAITESTFSDYIDDLSPAPKKTARPKISVRRKRALRSRNLTINEPAKPKSKRKEDRESDYSNDVQDLFSDTDPAFQQGGTILDAFLGDPGPKAGEASAKRKVGTKALMDEFPEVPEEEQRTSVFEKPAGTRKLSSSEASDALKHHKL